MGLELNHVRERSQLSLTIHLSTILREALKITIPKLGLKMTPLLLWLPPHILRKWVKENTLAIIKYMAVIIIIRRDKISIFNVIN